MSRRKLTSYMHTGVVLGIFVTDSIRIYLGKRASMSIEQPETHSEACLSSRPMKASTNSESVPHAIQ